MAVVLKALILVIPMIVLLFLARPVGVTSQPTGELQARFNQVIAQVHKAESAGATAWLQLWFNVTISPNG